MNRFSVHYDGPPAISTRTVLFVGFFAISLPVIARLASSPVVLVVLAPIVIILVAISCLLASISLGYTIDSKEVNRVNPLFHAARPLAFSTPAAWQAVLIRSQWTHGPSQSPSPLLPNMPIVSASLNEVITFIVRDFVLSWYDDISSSPSFPTAVSTTLRKSVDQLLERVCAVDFPSLIVKRILPKVTTHIEQFRLSEVALRGAGLQRHLTQSEELDMLLASKYASKDARLHPAVDNLSSTFTKQNEESHLRGIVDRILPQILPEQDAQSNILRIIVREIVVCAILYPIMDMVADPDFWNRTIDQVAGAAIHQQKLVSKVRNVLEAQSSRRHRSTPSKLTSGGDTITVRTDNPQFQSFLRSIHRCSSLLDARRLKNDVMVEIRRTRLLLANHEKDDWIDGERTEDVVAFLDRLYTAKRAVEQRIVVLGGEDPVTTISETSMGSRVSFRDVLSNPTSLSYFMEFMDRRHRSLLVQFWLTVESFKNPLESVDSGSEDEDDPIQDPSASTTLREDVSMINDLYFSTSPPHPCLLSISKKHVDTIRGYASNEVTPSGPEDKKVRRSVMLAQREVEQGMEQDFEDFQKSEFWFRVLEDSSSDNARIAAPQSRSIAPAPTATPKSNILSAGRIARSESSPSLALSGHPVVSGGRSIGSGYAKGASGVVLRSNIDVLMSPVTGAGTTRAPLFDDPIDRLCDADEAERMQAIQAALTDIIATDEQLRHPRSNDDNRPSAVQGSRTTHDIAEDDEYTNVEDGDEDGGGSSADMMKESFQLAGPGDLQLSHEIGRLENKLRELEAHATMLDTLIKKAELTDDTQELRLLRKAKSSMTREIRQLRFQKSQYEQQESANRLVPERTKVSIVNSTAGEEEGKSVVRYLVEVQQLAPNGSLASGWVVARRYNEFLRMHNQLRENYPTVRGLDFPGKRLVTSLTSSFVDTRRQALEKYMQNLIAIPTVCESKELRAFLSRVSPFIASEVKDEEPKGSGSYGRHLVRTMYRSVTESIDDMFFGPSMLDVMIQRLTRQAASLVGIADSAVNDEELVAQALKALGKITAVDSLIQMSGDLKLLDGETSSSSFSAPICDLVLAVFELDKKNNWLRRQAIVIILQQVLGDTIERKVRQSLSSLYEESQIVRLLGMLRDTIWPGGELRTLPQARTAEEKLRSRHEANRKLSALVPDLAANMIGRSNARRGARRMFAVLQNRRLNQHICYTILDEVVAAVFPETLTLATGSRATQP
ncbi:PhoX domain-containing protein [Pisolithus croceorrhizus]|nr:PhoX domain-containing protein [Pisolithus croceorrhizus]